MEHRLWINGRWEESSGGGKMPVGNPATGETIAEVIDANATDVRLVSVTGSTEVGQSIMRTAADTIKRVRLELGGKAPVLVFDDADVELVASKVALAGTINSGQDCTAATRVYVAEGLRKRVEEALAGALRSTKVGDPFDDDTRIGPMVSIAQRDSVKGYVDRAKSAGARIVTGGGIPKGREKGAWFEPTLIADPRQDSEIVQKEVSSSLASARTSRRRRWATTSSPSTSWSAIPEAGSPLRLTREEGR
jgi:betaine-aldehyde dehydrogenase